MSFLFLFASLVALLGNTLQIAAGDSCDGKSSRCAVESADAAAATADVQFKLLKVPTCAAAANRTEFQMTSFDDCKAKAIEKSSQGFQWIEEDTFCSVFDLNLDFVCEGNQVGDDVHVAWPPVDKGIKSNNCSQTPVSFFDFSYLSSLSSGIRTKILTETSTGGTIEDCAQSERKGTAYQMTIFDSSTRCFELQLMLDFEGCAADCGESQDYLLYTSLIAFEEAPGTVIFLNECGKTLEYDPASQGVSISLNLFSHEGFGCRPVPDMVSDDVDDCTVNIRANSGLMQFVMPIVDLSPGQSCSGDSLFVEDHNGIISAESCNSELFGDVVYVSPAKEITLKFKRVKGSSRGMGFSADISVLNI